MLQKPIEDPPKLESQESLFDRKVVFNNNEYRLNENDDQVFDQEIQKCKTNSIKNKRLS